MKFFVGVAVDEKAPSGGSSLSRSPFFHTSRGLCLTSRLGCAIIASGCISK
ncbi:MAG: hypothetical protein ACUVXH_11760 [Anaerolineae bacterium]